MKRILVLSLFSWILLSSVSCRHRLVGTWEVERYESKAHGQPTASLRHAGTLRFHRDYTGEKDLQYTLLGNPTRDRIPFRWEASPHKVTLHSQEASEFSKVWIVVEDRKKRQVWKSTDGSNRVQVLELRKK